MKIIKKTILVAAVLLAFGMANTTQAQDQGKKRTKGGQGGQGFDRNEFMKRMVDRMRERFEVKSDDEWAIIGERLGKVMEQRFSGFGGGRPPGGGGTTGRGRGGDNNQGGDNNRGGERSSGFRGDPNSAEGKLAKAIEDKASADVVKAALDKVRSERKEREDKLAKAQADLREVLTARQEAIAVLARMLD